MSFFFGKKKAGPNSGSREITSAGGNHPAPASAAVGAPSGGTPVNGAADKHKPSMDSAAPALAPNSSIPNAPPIGTKGMAPRGPLAVQSAAQEAEKEMELSRQAETQVGCVYIKIVGHQWTC